MFSVNSKYLLIATLSLFFQPCFCKEIVIAPTKLHCNEQKKSQIIVLPHSTTELKFTIDDGNGWIELEDIGQSTILDYESGEIIDIPQPLRYDWHWVNAEAGKNIVIHRTESNNAFGKIRIYLHCNISSEFQSRIAWLKNLSDSARALNNPLKEKNLKEIQLRILELEASAPDAKSHAIALHLSALISLIRGTVKDSCALFKQAEASWSALGDVERATAAHIGYLESLYAGGDFSGVINHTNSVEEIISANNYFAVRQENSRCLSLNKLGRLVEAQRCYEWMLENYKRLDESRDYTVLLQNYATFRYETGDLDAAVLLAAKGLKVASGPYAPTLRGRLHLLQADIALHRGFVIESLADANLANDEFVEAKDARTRWQANTSMKIAEIYQHIGAIDEAYASLGEAVALLRTMDAPARMALAMSVFADLEQEGRHFDSALAWLRLAETTYSQLGMTPDADSVLATRLQLQLQLGQLSPVKAALSIHSGTKLLSEKSWQMLAAELALKQSRVEEARRVLDGLSATPLSLRDQIHLTQLNAEYASRKLDIHGALNILFETAKRIDALAQTTNNPTLRYVIARQILPLRRMAFSLALEQMSGTGSPVSLDTIWPWLALTASTSIDVITRPQSTKTAEQFDRAVAEELLTSAANTNQNSGSAAHHELLSLLADTHEGATGTKKSNAPNTPITLVNLQQTLAADSAFIAYIDGDTRGGLLWVTRDNALMLDAATPYEISSSVLALRELLRSPSSPLPEIHQAAQRLSTQLFAYVPTTIAPQRLLVLADESLNGVGWSVLSWAAQKAETPQTLLDSSTISTVRLQRGGNVASTDAIHDLHVLMAAQTGSASLPNLAGVGVEAGLIESAITDRTIINLHGGASATRGSVLGALSEAGAWVHIAAHGMAQPQRIGYAGIWLEPAAPEVTPAFLSWLDVLDSGSNADLVVLNACQLGDSGNAINGNLSFAAAVSRAGAKKVVAALWPISDSASALWVPAFYSTMNQGPNHDAAGALRVAQLRLRNSRAFQHPFFWAGMQIIERLPVQDTDMDLAKLPKEKLH